MQFSFIDVVLNYSLPLENLFPLVHRYPMLLPETQRYRTARRIFIFLALASLVIGVPYFQSISLELWMVTLSLTLLPPFAILFAILKSDKIPEPPKSLISAFILGFLLCLPAGELNYLLIEKSADPDFYIFLAGVTEETLKFIAIYLFFWDRVEFDEPMDAIVYGTLISLGFATFENYEYVYLYNGELSSLSVAFIRSISAIPLHACCGIIMGYHLGRFKFSGNRWLLATALLLPILIHSIYNFLTAFGLLLYLFLIPVIWYTFWQHRHARKDQKNFS